MAMLFPLSPLNPAKGEAPASDLAQNRTQIPPPPLWRVGIVHVQLCHGAACPRVFCRACCRVFCCAFKGKHA